MTSGVAGSWVAVSTQHFVTGCNNVETGNQYMWVTQIKGKALKTPEQNQLGLLGGVGLNFSKSAGSYT